MILSYSDLKANLITSVEDASEDVVLYVPEAIALAENRVSRELDYGWLEVFNTFSPITSDIVEKELIVDETEIPQTVDVVDAVSTTLRNSTFIAFTYIYYIDADGKKHKLSLVQESFINEYEAKCKRAGTPKYVAMVNRNVSKLRIAPKPVYTGGGDHKLHVIYKWVTTPLSDSNPTNLVLQKAPTLLRLAALAELYEFLHNKEAATFYHNRYSADLASHLNVSRRETQDEGLKHISSNVELQRTTP